MTGATIAGTMAAIGGGAAVAGFVASNINGQAAVGGSSGASLTWWEDGSITYTTSGTDKSTVGSTAFWNPVKTGNLTGRLWIKVTATGTVDSGNVTGAWTAFPAAGGNFTWTQVAGLNDASASLTIQLATDAAGANVVLNSAGNVVRRTHV